MHHFFPAGGSIYIYNFILDGGWSAWSSWLSCCINEKTISRRECNNPLPQNGGVNCSGDEVKIKLEPCQRVPCISNLNYCLCCCL